MYNCLKIVLCTVLISVCGATPNCLELHQSQLNSLNERMNQMLGALYSSPILSKLQSVTKTQPNSSSTTPAETPEPVHDTPAYYPSTTPQVVYVANKYPAPAAVAPAAHVSRPTSIPRSYYTQDIPFEYSHPSPLLSPWSQYYDPYHPSLKPQLQNPLTYDPYREEYLPPYPTYSPPPTYHAPAYYTPPAYTPPSTYHTPPPAYPVPPPTYHTPPAYHTSPTYHTPPPVYAAAPSAPYPPVHYATLADYPPFYV